ncbi:tyrosine-type recombinase/integrase [Pseudomonas guariconensis]|uniref:tyrosine-type recombinase/integrase n=1 Tax=Pseudomonas guariconensis TaxID=1288410 RepID=UPI0018D6183B|nr:tyrosine-type recombinase/integrase [Pseudomonas guariconensis]MBH3360210.1 tyrosine-type recombinase/integrase [Pseudomonas guariconensis]
MCILAGLRPSEFRSARWVGNQAVFQEFKTRRDDYIPLPESCQDAVAKYARASNLSEGDLLFHSHGDRNRPMPATTLTRMLTTLADKAAIKLEGVTANQIRRTVLKDGIAELTGHRSRTTASGYMAKDGGEIKPTLH